MVPNDSDFASCCGVTSIIHEAPRGISCVLHVFRRVQQVAVVQAASGLLKHSHHSLAQGPSSGCLMENKSARNLNLRGSAEPMPPWPFAAKLE